MAEVGRKHSLDDDGIAPARKKLKLSDLPIAQSKRSAIDSLLHTFRKTGEYDAMRKLLFTQFEVDPAKSALLTSLEDLVERETDRDPHLLSKDPRVAATLIEGAGERSDIYKNVATTISTLIDKLFDSQGAQKMREFRIKEVGAEVAAEEEQRGSKTSEDYQREADGRRQDRIAAREKDLEKQRQREKEELAIKEAKREERRRREKEEEDAREKERQEREERRRKEREERDREEEERRRQDRERIEREREEKRLRRRREDEEYEQRRREREDRDRRRPRYRSRTRSRSPSRTRHRSRTRSPDRNRDRGRRRTRSRSPEPANPINVDDIKIDDDAAMEALLRETEDLKKSRQRPTLERSESLEPPMRKAHPPKLLVPRDPVAARLAKMDTKSQSPAGKSDTKTPVPTVEATPPPPTRRDSDINMLDTPVPKSEEKRLKSRFDLPPLPKQEEKRPHSRTRSRSRRSPSIRSRKHSRSRSRGSRYDGRRASRFEDDRYSRDDRMSYRPGNDRRRDRDDRDDKRSRRESRSPSRETFSSRRKSRIPSRSPSRDRRERDRRRSRSRSRSRERRFRDHSRRGGRRNRSRSRSPDGIDRYVPGGRGKGIDPRDETPARDKDRGYRARDYERRGNTRFQESDCYNPAQDRDKDRDRDRDRDRDDDRDRDRDRNRDRDRDRRRRDRSRTKSRSRSRSRARR